MRQRPTFSRAEEFLVKCASNEKDDLREIVQLKESDAISTMFSIRTMRLYCNGFDQRVASNGSKNTFQRSTMETVSQQDEYYSALLGSNR
jgi:hypothetical protein